MASVDVCSVCGQIDTPRGVLAHGGRSSHTTCRDAEGAVVGREDAAGVVRTLSGTAVGHVGPGGDITPVPSEEDGAASRCLGWKLDQTTRAVVDGGGRVLGTIRRGSAGELRGHGGSQHGVAAMSAAEGLEVMAGVHEDLGLLWDGDGKVVGSCVLRAVAGMAVVSTAGKIIGDVGQDGTVMGRNGAPHLRAVSVVVMMRLFSVAHTCISTEMPLLQCHDNFPALQSVRWQTCVHGRKSAPYLVPF